MRETRHPRQSGDPHRSPKFLRNRSLWTAASIAALGCGLTLADDQRIYKKGEHSELFRGIGVMRETHLPRQSGDPHRSPKFLRNRSLWTAASIAALGCGLTFADDQRIYKKGEHSELFRGIGVMRETHHPRQSGDPHRSPKFLRNRSMIISL